MAGMAAAFRMRTSGTRRLFHPSKSDAGRRKADETDCRTGPEAVGAWAISEKGIPCLCLAARPGRRRPAGPVPGTAGQYAEYTEDQLKKFRAGTSAATIRAKDDAHDRRQAVGPADEGRCRIRCRPALISRIIPMKCPTCGRHFVCCRPRTAALDVIPHAAFRRRPAREQQEKQDENAQAASGRKDAIAGRRFRKTPCSMPWIK